MSQKKEYLYNNDDVARIAENNYLQRMKKGEYWGTAEGDWEFAKKKCEEWWPNGRINT